MVFRGSADATTHVPVSLRGCQIITNPNQPRRCAYPFHAGLGGSAYHAQLYSEPVT